MSETEETGCCPGFSPAGTSGLAAGDYKAHTWMLIQDCSLLMHVSIIGHREMIQ